MTSWINPQHHQHPWFVKPTLKRKHSPEYERYPLPPKRIRKLESGFAGLTLEHNNLPLSSPISSALTASPPPSPTHVIYPLSVEEPAEAPEVKMTSTSWYEPEKDRIVITDLSDSEEEEDTSKPDFTIAPAFLNALNKRLGIATLSVKPPINSEPTAPVSKALILFQPPESFHRVEAPDKDRDSYSHEPDNGDDAMDVDTTPVISS